MHRQKILAEQESWRQRVESVRGVDTRSLWLYFRPDLAALGWSAPPLVLTSDVQPYATWEEVSFLRTGSSSETRATPVSDASADWLSG